jgi:hypothetical protein
VHGFRAAIESSIVSLTHATACGLMIYMYIAIDGTQLVLRGLKESPQIISEAPMVSKISLKYNILSL